MRNSAVPFGGAYPQIDYCVNPKPCVKPTIPNYYHQIAREIRTVTFEGARLRVFYYPIILERRNHRDALLEIAGGNMLLSVNLSTDKAQSKKELFETSEIETREAAVAKGSGVPKDFTNYIDESIRAAFERMIVAVAAEQEQPPKRPPRDPN